MALSCYTRHPYLVLYDPRTCALRYNTNEYRRVHYIGAPSTGSHDIPIYIHSQFEPLSHVMYHYSQRYPYHTRRDLHARGTYTARGNREGVAYDQKNFITNISYHSPFVIAHYRIVSLLYMSVLPLSPDRTGPEHTYPL